MEGSYSTVGPDNQGMYVRGIYGWPPAVSGAMARGGYFGVELATDRLVVYKIGPVHTWSAIGALGPSTPAPNPSAATGSEAWCECILEADLSIPAPINKT